MTASTDLSHHLLEALVAASRPPSHLEPYDDGSTKTSWTDSVDELGGRTLESLCGRKERSNA